MMWNTPATTAIGVEMPNSSVISPRWRDGRVGQQALQIVLEDRVPGAYQQGQRADGTDHVEEQVGARQRRVQARQQEHARLHHRGRVQVGRYRRGRGHRVRQPEMEGELRALGEHAGQHQRQRPRIQRAATDQVARGQHHVQVVAADDAPEQQHAAEQRQPAGAGDGQRHARAFARILPMRPEPDQQERADARQLPEHHQQQQVAGQHHAQHRTHEQQQGGEEPRRAVLLAEVVARVHHHQPADRQHQPGEHPRQPIQPQGERQADLGNPGVVGTQVPAIQHTGRHPCQQHQAQQRCQAGQPCGGAARKAARQRHHQREHERQRQQDFKERDHQPPCVAGNASFASNRPEFNKPVHNCLSRHSVRRAARSPAPPNPRRPPSADRLPCG